MSLEQPQAQIDALVLAGEVTADPGTLALWQQVREQAPEAWCEMAEHVVLMGRGDLLHALVRQCDPFWGCQAPLGDEVIGQVRALLDEAVERWR